MNEVIKNLPPETRIGILVAEYCYLTSQGCIPTCVYLATGKPQKRANEIARILGISADEVTSLIGAVNLARMAGDTKEEVLQNAYFGAMAGTSGGKRTGNADEDNKVINTACFVKIVIYTVYS